MDICRQACVFKNMTVSFKKKQTKKQQQSFANVKKLDRRETSLLLCESIFSSVASGNHVFTRFVLNLAVENSRSRPKRSGCDALLGRSSCSRTSAADSHI